MLELCVQVSPSRVLLKLRSSVMTKVMGRVTCDTGQQSQATMLSMSYVMMRTLKIAPSWLTSSQIPATSFLKKSEQNFNISPLAEALLPNLTFWISSPLQVKCFGPGLEPFGCIINKAADFTIDAQEAGRGELKLYAQVRS